ncbi:MAG: 16S rRNA (guanine(527)-N(7))-methyltransferase RsmG [Pseudomonadota bacterium]|nr:16S rRNA (guanine(527)-N(7))-methyltransferase RsmG [Pseudomonadota bacterium]
MRKVKIVPLSRHRLPTENFNFREASERLEELFRNHGLPDFSREKRQKLLKFYFLLMKHQKTYNLTRLVKLRDVAIKHFIDCVLVPRLVKLKFPLIDMGSGAGFPGIPLKICFPEERIILVEGVQKKVDFLKIVREELELKNLDIIGRKIDADFHYPAPGFITRAVEEIPGNLRRIAHFVPKDGEVYFMKGPNVSEEIQRAQLELKNAFELKADIPYQIPKTPHDRRLVVYTKL